MALKQLLRKLEKEKVEIEWQLKEMEWRLDQESSVRVLVVLRHSFVNLLVTF